MARKRLNVELTPEEYEFLTTSVAQGQKNARSINRARTLLMAHNGKDDRELAKTLGISRATVYNIRRRDHQHKHDDLALLLQEKPRKGRPLVLDTQVEAHGAMVACSEAPKGAARWTLQLIADKLVQLNVVNSISHESVRSLLKKNRVAK